MNARNNDRSNLLPEEYIDNVCNANDIIDIVSETVQLKKAGKEYIGLCPFHSEKSPSFSVNQEKQSYVCRGCGQSGKIIKYLQDDRGYGYIEAIEYLAAKANMPSPDQVRPKNNLQSKEYLEQKLIIEILEKARDLYKAELFKSEAALKYLDSRDLQIEDVEKFQIGYAPKRSEGFLKKHFADVDPELLFKAGLYAKNENSTYGSPYYEAIHDRVIFPIHNISGKCVAFGGRSLDPEGKPKYLNTRETSVFSKGRELYGWYEAKNAISKEKKVIVAEGYLDTILPSGHGFENIVSCMGVAIRETTVAKLFKSANEIVYCFDGDDAGKRAASRSAQIMLPLIDEDHTCSFVFIPNNMDPDEYVKEHGHEAFQAVLDSAIPISEFLISDLASKHDLSKIEGKAKFAKEASEMVSLVNSDILRQLYVHGIKEAIGMDMAINLKPLAPKVLPQQPDSPVSRSDARVPKVEQIRADNERRAEVMQKSGFMSYRQIIKKPVAEAPKELPSMALQIVGLLTTDSNAAKLFNPTWLNFAPNSKPEEIGAATAIHELCKETKEPLSQDEIVDALAKTPHAAVIKKSMAIEGASIEDPIEQLGNMANFLMELREKKQNLNSAKDKFFRRGP